MAFIARASSGLPGPTDGLFVAPSVKVKFVVHWDGGRNPASAADELTLLRAYIAHHIRQGWRGPAYNLAVGPITGNVYELRGLNAVGTHAPGANRDGIGVILIGGPGNLTEAGKRGLREAYALACAHTGNQLLQRVHHDVVPTTCPGDEVTAWVRGGGLVGANAPASTGAEFTGRNLTSRSVTEIQAAVGVTADGVYGPGTTAAVRAWQESRGLVADGIWGPASDGVAFDDAMTLEQERKLNHMVARVDAVYAAVFGPANVGAKELSWRDGPAPGSGKTARYGALPIVIHNQTLIAGLATQVAQLTEAVRRVVP